MLELICEIADCLKQSLLTVHLSVEYLDRYLLLRNHFTEVKPDTDIVSRLFEGHSVDVVALSCLLLASKFDEIDDNIPLMEEFCKAHNLVRDSLDSGFLHSQSSRQRLLHGRSYPGFHAL